MKYKKLDKPVKLVPREYRVLLAQMAATILTQVSGDISGAVTIAHALLNRSGIEEAMIIEGDSYDPYDV